MKDITRLFASCCLIAFTASPALCSAGYIVAWGTDREGLHSVPDGMGFVQVSTGGLHALARRSDGTVEAWGSESFGRCDVPANTLFTTIDAGSERGMGITLDGEYRTWGGVFGSGGGRGKQPPPHIELAGIKAGGWSWAAWTESGDSYIWGYPLGREGGADGFYIQSPWDKPCEQVAPFGAMWGAALLKTGQIVTWDGSIAIPAPSGSDFVAVSAGQAHGLGLRSNGSLVGFGHNDYGQCDVPLGDDFIAVAAGGFHSLALRRDGTVEAWGMNDEGQCDVPSGHVYQSISAGTASSMAIAIPEPTSLVLLALGGAAALIRATRWDTQGHSRMA